MKEKINKLDFIFKKDFLLCKIYCQENKKANHKLIEYVCKRHIWWKTVIQNMQKKKNT